MSTAMAHTSPDRTSAATTPQAQQQQQHGVTTTTTTAATRTTCGVVMPREVVAWLQTLQLSRAIRHPRRDLADGCLVAEVCARYWHDVPLHAFERKTSVQQKLSNWTVLRRVFARHETELGERVITGMVQSTPHYAEAFLLQLYTLLTGRRVHIAAPLPCGAEEVAMPPYNPRAYASTTPALQLAQTHTTMPTRQREAQQQQHASSSPHRGDGVVTAAMATLLLGSNGNHNNITMPHEHTVATPSRAMHAMQPVASNTTAAVAQQQQQPRRASLASSHEPPVRLSVVAVKAIDRTASTTRQQQPQQPQPLQSRTAADEHDSASPTWCVAWLDDLLQSQLPSCRAWPVAHDAVMTTPPPATAAAVVIARTAPVLAYFLQHEDALDAAVQNAVWGVLLSRVDVLVRHVQRTPLALTTLTQWFALPHVRVATATTTAAAVDDETTYNNNNDDNDSSAVMRHASARAIAFLATVVTQWCDVDAHAAFAAFVRNVLAVPALRARLRRLDAASADVYASLLCAVVPRDRSLTQTMLPPLLSAVGEAVLQRPCCCSSSVDDDGAAVAAAVLCARSDAAAVSFLVLLRVWALQLLRALPPRGRSTPAAMTATTTTTTTTTAAAATSSSLSPPPSSSLPSSSTSGARVVSSASTTSVAIDGAMAALYRTVAQCAQAALSSPSSSLRLLGAALAVTLTRHEWPAAVATTTATTAYTAAMTTAAADDNDDYDDDDATALQQLLFPARTRVQRGGSRAHATASLSLQVLPTDEPWLHVQRAIWLRRQYEHMAAAAITTTAVASPHTCRLSAAATTVSARARATRRHVAAATRSLCALLRRRGVVAPCAKAVMAYEMASLLPSLHACCCNHNNNNKSSRSSCHVTRQQPQQQPQASTPAGDDDDDDDVDNTLAHDVACAVMTYYVYEASDDVVACAFATRTATARSGSRNNGSSSGSPVATHATNTATPQQQQQSQQQYHHLLGGYDVCAVMRHSSALLLTAAMLDVLPPTSHDDRNDAVRRLHARAALLARDRVPSPALQQRIEWLYRLHCSADDNDDIDDSGSRRVVVGGGGSRVRALLSRSPHNSHSGGGSYAHASGATRDGDASQQQQHWHALLRALYPDVALVTMAAEMAMRMHGGGNSSNNNNSSSHARASVDARMAVLLTLAGKAQHVVQRWYAQRATAAVRNSNSIAATDAAHDDDDNAAAAASEHEAMTRAMTWYHEHYKAVDV